MDNKVIWIIYYSVSLLLSIMMIRETKDKGYKFIGILFAVTFSYFLISYFDLIVRMGFEFITITVACIWYIVKGMRSNDIQLLDKIFLTTLPLITAFRLGFKILHLNGWNELGLFSLLILLVTICYLLIIYVRKRTFSNLKEAVELNGLFGIILIPTLI